MIAAGGPGWHPHVDTWVLLGALGVAYLTALARHRRATPAGGDAASPAAVAPAAAAPAAAAPGAVAPAASLRQKAAFLGGVAVLWVGSDWPVHDLAERYLYSVHMAQHLLFTLVGALLLVAGTPEWMARRLLAPAWLRAAVRALARPVPALIQANVVLVVSHWPLVVNATVRNHPLHFAAHAVLLASAVLMWLPVASPTREVRRLRPPLAMLYLFGQTILPTVPASFLTFGSEPLYRAYTELPRLWGLSVLEDQQLAGLIMKVGGGFYLWMVIAVVFFVWCARDEGSDGGSEEETLHYHEVEHELVR